MLNPDFDYFVCISVKRPSSKRYGLFWQKGNWIIKKCFLYKIVFLQIDCTEIFITLQIDSAIFSQSQCIQNRIISQIG